VQATSSTPAVLVVLVAHDGARWLPRTLAALDAQVHAALDTVAVDNGSTDASRALLQEHLGEDRVLVADRDLGFGAAVAMALDAHAGHEAPYVLLLHDDCALDADAVHHLVAELEADPNLAMVGPKLRDWSDGDRLQSVGWTIDLTGRADSGVDDGELDQGQRDQDRRALYVSSAGMLVRREVFDALGRFDRRYHVFRDDLDLCWRAWLTGYDVEVVTDAVGHHVAGATNYLRLGQTRFLGPRYFSERNTLATLLKNYAAPRLTVVVPLYFLVGIAKVFGFLLTRRVSDAWQTVRAWVWNLLHLLETLRLRREVQRNRVRSDAQLRELFGRIVPRLRAYAEAIGDWVAGGDVGPDDEPVPQVREVTEREPTLRRLRHFARRRAVTVVGGVLALIVLVGAIPLLLPGDLRGGDLAPWPDGAGAFLVDYLRSWHQASAFGTAEAPSPAQAILGLTQLLVLGNDWLAPRLVLLGALAAGWVLALRATQTYSQGRPARVAAASAYILSPPALAALATGHLGGLALLATLPGIVAAGVTSLRRGTAPDRAWRAVAAVVLLTGVAGAFEPVVLPALAAVWLVAALGCLVAARDSLWRRAIAIRSLAAAAGPWLLLLPWSARLFRWDGPLLGVDGPVVASELWRWMLLAPDLPGLPGPLVGGGFVLAGLLGLAMGAARRPGLVGGLYAVAVLASVSGWAAGRVGALAWPGVPLVVAAAAYAGLFAVAFASAETVLARHEFGWRHLMVAGTGLVVLVSLGAVAGQLLLGPWEAYAVDEESLPTFVTTAAEEGDFRVLVLSDDGETVGWEVVDGSGPSMAAYGIDEPPVVREELTGIVAAVLQGTDAGAVGRLGTLNVRYVVVPEEGTSDRLDAVLREQFALEPRPVATGRVMRVGTWLPRATVVPDAAADGLARRGQIPGDVRRAPLAPTGEGYAGTVATPGSLLVAEAPDADWQARAGGARLELEDGPSGATMVGPVADSGVDVRVEHAGEVGRRVAVAWQVLAVLLVISLALRPPGFARALREEYR
jgi:GT2 family glycosyltransferase